MLPEAGSWSTGSRITDRMAAGSQEKATGGARSCGDGNAKAMHIEIVTLFPELVEAAASYGVTGRARERAVDLELSIGDFVVSVGELPALLLIDAIVRQLPGVLNDAQSSVEDSFVDGLLDCPHYTRPEVYQGRAVPAVLLSGDHAAIARWRLKQAVGRTWLRRPELLAARGTSAGESVLLEEFRQEREAGTRYR